MRIIINKLSNFKINRLFIIIIIINNLICFKINIFFKVLLKISFMLKKEEIMYQKCFFKGMEQIKLKRMFDYELTIKL